MGIKAIIIDDEQGIVEGMKKMLEWYCPDVEVLGTADSIESGIPLIQQSDIDLLFLDIHLRDGSGIELLKRLKLRKFQVIFITGYDGYAIEAFRFSAIDYLLKPLDPDDLVQAVEKARDVIDKAHLQVRLSVLMDNLREISHPARKIVLKDAESIHVVQLDEILFCKADGCYTSFTFQDGRVILSSKNLKTFETLLQQHNFFRCHHSYLVNMEHVKRFDKTEGGQLVLSDNHLVPVSKRKRERLVEKIQSSTNLFYR